ncbi:DUF7287 family protein [Halalkalicoccus tibetensis]|uniref:Pilin/flagellin n=1 Tax=Halalkalicoccus tibetensis TaxID=175632 RepID=A0ABD5V7M0_9EURY
MSDDGDTRAGAGRSGRWRTDERAQLTIDFLVGAAMFLMVVGFVFALVPEMIVPFGASQSAHPAVADRTATHLADDALADEPGVLDESEVEEFFGGSDDSGEFVAELGVSEPARLNVAIDGTDHERGPTPPESADVTVAERTVTYDGEAHRLVVEVW